MKLRGDKAPIIGSLTVILLALLNLGLGDSAADRVGEGNRLYREGKYDQALKSYSQAQLEKPESAPIFFNIGDVHYRKEEMEKAGSLFQKALESTDPGVSARAAYNLGNTLYRKGDLEGALKAYKDSIRLDSSDLDAKYNYELARKKLKEQQQQKQQQQDQKQQQKDQQQEKQEKEEKEDEQQDNKKEEEKKKEDGEKKESDKKDESKEREKQEKEKKKNEERKEDRQSQQPQPQPSPKEDEQGGTAAAGQEEKMDPEDMERLLNAIRAEEEQQREMMLKERQGKTPEVLKDW